MVKTITSVNVDADILEEARQNFINISEAAEHGLKDRLGKRQVEIETEVHKCANCGMEGEKETKEDIQKHGHFSKSNKLIWIYPYEEWMCNRCLRTISMTQ